MIDQIISVLTHFITTFIQSTGYWGIFVLMTLESALIPIPSEVTMPFAGYISSLGSLNFWLVVFVGAFSNLVGSLIAYGIGYWGEETFIHTLINKYGKYVLISMDEYEKSEKWFRKYGERIVFFARILPVLRTFISLPAGIAEMNIVKFSLFTFIGSFIWSLFLTYIGFTLGRNWHSIEGIYRKFEYAIVAVGILVVGYYIFHKIQKVRQTKR